MRGFLPSAFPLPNPCFLASIPSFTTRNLSDLRTQLMSLLKKLFGSTGDISSSNTQGQGMLGAVSRLFDKNEKEIARLQPMVSAVGAIGTELKDLSDDELKARSAATQTKVRG